MENGPFLFLAFGLVWAVVFGYLLILLNRQKQLKRDLDSLQKTLSKKESI